MNGLPRLRAEQSVIVGRNMSVLRKRAGWTLADLGKRLGKDSSTVYRMEKGERRIAYADAALLADIFQIPPVDLIAQCRNCHGSPPPGFACLACG
jgi:transcriptional regulator with XRE-family HTH domain